MENDPCELMGILHRLVRSAADWGLISAAAASTDIEQIYSRLEIVAKHLDTMLAMSSSDRAAELRGKLVAFGGALALARERLPLAATAERTPTNV
jgi:hypothetical protein